ncbi:YraN family protein [Paenibacillus alkalitolerans]|uniref:YraN family protein n=1 Tax=Paenibacillus alkalitolerans TaxID=2799335 RepID=UPI0018F75DE8|nr:YraN family protein [Paenibacillus alkalitolerans]
MTKSRKAAGTEGERLAQEHLALYGYEILDVNWRCKAGELDIVAKKDGTLIFVEVRARTASSMHAFGAPQESVDYRKRMKLRRLAEIYLLQTGRSGVPVRFDVIAVTLASIGGASDIRHIQNAL